MTHDLLFMFYIECAAPAPAPVGLQDPAMRVPTPVHVSQKTDRSVRRWVAVPGVVGPS